jgi:hypothetical protein
LVHDQRSAGLASLPVAFPHHHKLIARLKAETVPDFFWDDDLPARGQLRR